MPLPTSAPSQELLQHRLDGSSGPALVPFWKHNHSSVTRLSRDSSTSTLNPLPFEANANGAIVAVGTSGASCLYTSNPTELLVDFNGWWI